MSKHLKEKLLLNCGRKRKMTLAEAKGQQKARNQSTRIYKCDKCGTYHTTKRRGGISKSAWDKL